MKSREKSCASKVRERKWDKSRFAWKSLAREGSGENHFAWKVIRSLAREEMR